MSYEDALEILLSYIKNCDLNNEEKLLVKIASENLKDAISKLDLVWCYLHNEQLSETGKKKLKEWFEKC